MKKELQVFIPMNRWPADDRPREKLISKGASLLSNAELLALLLGTGNKNQTALDLSKQVLALSNNRLAELSCKTLIELQKIKGIGEAKAIVIIAALEISRRREAEQPIDKVRILSSADAAQLIQPLIADLPYETFNVMHLSRNNTLLKTEQISKGGVSGTVVDAKIIFKSAIESLASGLILCHNHPSGNLQPSQEDLKITEQLHQAGKLLGIQVYDHIIVSSKGFFSFADEGYIK